MGLFGLHLLFRKGILASKLLGLYLCLICFRIVTSYFTTNGRLLEFPELALIQSPCHFLIAPVHFLFVFYILNPQKKFSKFFWLLFIPFILHLAEMIPFYFGPLENKIQEIQLIMKHKSLVNYPSQVNHLPTLVLSLLKVGLSFIYAFLSLGWVLYSIKRSSKAMYLKNKWLLNWILIESSLGLASVVLSILYALGVIGFNNLRFSYADTLMLMGSFVNLGVIVIRPALLNGTTFQSLVNRIYENKKPNTANDQKLSAKYESIAKQLEELFLVNKPFLDSSLRIESVAQSLGISTRDLSNAVQFMYKFSYPDFVNSWRINYILEQRKQNPVWQNYSQEMLAEASGFGSRQGLYIAINKLYGMTPSAFFAAKEAE
jgi:AraC-like DNA-binding protein